MAGVDKVGMSLDDIIKLNKGSRGRGGGRGRGRGGRSSVRGGQSGGQSQKRGASNNRSRAGGVAKSGFGMRRVKRGGVTKRGARGRGGGLFSARRQLPADAWQHDMFEGAVVRGGGVGGRVGAASVANGGGSSTLLISNLDWGVSDSDIKELFGEFGPLRKATLHYDKSGRSLGTAEVIYGRPADALRAMNKYNNVLLDGRTMRIQLVGGTAAAPVTKVSSAVQGQGRGKARGGQQRGGRKFGGFRAGGMQQRSAFRRGGGAVARGRGGRGRGGKRGGKGPALSKDQLDAQLDNYNKKDRMDME